MSTPPAISLQQVGKRYVVRDEQAMLLRAVLPGRRAPHEERWALQGVDLEVARGEAVGVVGHNGAGKTTLLRMMAAVSRPTTGRISITGRVAPLIGLGVGFHPEMSGRENVYVNGMLLGLTRAEVDQRFDEIVSFAELEDAIDGPVKFYSSGMFMRLGFAVAAHVDPEVLLVDELLAVGDLAFQLKCFDRMRALKEGGATIVVVSHSMHAIRVLCDRAVLIRAGVVELDADVESVTRRHEEVLALGDRDDADLPSGAAPVTLLDRVLLGADGPTDRLDPGVPTVLRVRFRFETEVDSPQVHFTVQAADGAVVYQMRAVLHRVHRSYRRGEVAVAETSFTPHLLGGPYRLLVSVTSIDGSQVLLRDVSGLEAWAPAPSTAGGFVDLGASFRFG